MKYLLIPVFLVLTTGCGTMERMTHLIEQSTQSIHYNRMAVERSTEVIKENSEHIQGSSHAIEQNRKALQSM